MAQYLLAVAFSFIFAISPAAAAANPGPPPVGPAPTDSPDVRYCLRVEAVTGTRLETVQCWTRGEWVEQGVDVDHDWAKEGVAVLEPGERQLTM